MNLSPGTRIGPYEVLSAIGAGGMGEVYQARDTKLNRSVALKILPPAFANDPDRLARFKREAQVLASLNHPNIAAIYGLEDSPSTSSERAAVLALVMELVPGRTLSELISAPMPVADALPIARQIASALEAAHEQGVIHRDLKPANIKITDDGTVKVLDFGLAKALAPAAGSGEPGGTDSPTLTSPAMTEIGMILGTAGYMAPEQAKGKPVDRRVDLWALGVVLFEMLAGKGLYRGETVTETIAHVITQPPDWNMLPASTPAPVRRLLRRLLEKDPRNRLQSAGDVRLDIDEIASGAADGNGAPAQAGPAAPALPAWRRALPWTLAALLLVALLVSAWPRAVEPVPSMRLEMRVGSGEALAADPNEDGAVVVISPDGQTLAYLGTSSAGRRLYVRQLDRLESAPLSGTEGALQHFFSPDGRSIGFFANGRLMRTTLSGGAPIPVTDAVAARGGTWGTDDTIVFTGDMTAGLSRVPAAGGTATVLTKLGPNERTHRWPSFLPNAKAVLFMCQLGNAAYDDGTIEAVRIDTGERKVLIRGGTFPQYVTSGHLVYSRQNTVYAVRFDQDRLEVTGEPQPVLTGVLASGGGVGAGSGNGAAQFAIARNGTAAYLTGELSTSSAVRLAIVDRTGKVTYEFPERRLFADPKFSPEGRRLAVRVGDGKTESLHVLDLSRGTLTKLVFDGAFSGIPVWTHDGEQIAFSSDRNGKGLDVSLMRSDGTGEIKTLTPSGVTRFASSFSMDNRFLVLSEVNPKTNMDVLVLSLADGKLTPFVNSTNIEMLGVLSPDGAWLAYQMGDVSGGAVSEIYVRSYPDGGALRQVSSGGGFIPRWTKGGRELVYAAPAKTTASIMAVDVSVEGKALSLGKPQRLFDVPLAELSSGVVLDASADGNRFALVLTAPDDKAAQPQRTHVTLVLNLFEEIRKATNK